MPQREKRSVSLPPDLAHAIDVAAADAGTSFSAWLAETASHRLRLEAAQKGISEWEQENGPLTDEEKEEGYTRAGELLGRSRRPRRTA